MGEGATVSVESIGLSEYWLVCCPPWLQARYDRSVPSGSQTGLFYLYRPAFFFFALYHSQRGVREHNYSVIMAVTTLLRHNLYRWSTENDDLWVLPIQRPHFSRRTWRKPPAGCKKRSQGGGLLTMFFFIIKWWWQSWKNKIDSVQFASNWINWIFCYICYYEW